MNVLSPIRTAYFLSFASPEIPTTTPRALLTPSATASLPLRVPVFGGPAGDTYGEVAVIVPPGDRGGLVGIREALWDKPFPKRIACPAVQGVVAAVADQDALAVADLSVRANSPRWSPGRTSIGYEWTETTPAGSASCRRRDVCRMRHKRGLVVADQVLVGQRA
jgi:hypothetical protein